MTRNSLRYLTIALILAHVAGGTAPADAAPASPAGMALRFAGDNDAIRVKRSKILEPGELTIELWAKLPGGDAKQEPQGENARFVRKVSAPDRRGYIFGPSQAGVPFAQFRYDVPIRYLPDTLANNAYGNDWHHFAAIYSLSEAVLVVDGLEVARQKHERERLGHDADADFSIGADGFRGYIDELKIWQTTRTVQAIRDGMYHRSTGREPGLIAYWRFDDRRLENTAPTALEILTPLADDSRLVESGVPVDSTEQMRDHQAGALKVAKRREESERVAAHLPPLNATIYRFGSGLNGDAFGNGDCWNFVNQAMIFAGANRSALYLFGAKVSLKDALPGDVVQFEKFSGPTFGTGHHSAVLVRNHGDGVITVVHQNAPPNGAKVGMWDIDVAKSKGTIIFFRPRK